MKRHCLPIVISLALSILIIDSTSSQNLLTSADMSSEINWILGNNPNNQWTEEAFFTFGYADDVPNAGTGSCLRVVGEIDPQGAEAKIDAYCVQQVTLSAGTTYMVGGAFKDRTDGGVYNFWCEMGLSPANPIETSNDTVNYLLGINTWDGCGSELDGSFEADFCKYTGPYFSVPDEPAGDQAYYFVILIGCWDNTTEMHDFDVLIDEVFVVDSATIEPTALGDNDMPARNSIFSLSPNPSIGNVKITSARIDQVNIEVYNSNGSLIKNGKLSIPASIDLSDQDKGIYFIRIQSDTGIETHRLILQ